MTARSQEGPLEIGEIFCGKYEVVEFVGRGGSGHVYKALHTFLGKHVAIKAIFRPDGLHREAVRRAQAEAQIMNALRHPNLCEVADAGTVDGLVYIVMEFLRGRPMRAALNDYGALRIEEALGLCAQIAEGVHAAHLAGVIHRDLKPDNAFIQAGNRTKVLDFGVAKLIDAGAWSTQKGVVHGTAYYMSPEQIHLGTLAPTSDVFALGLVLYEALIGRHPVSLVTDSPVPTFWEICRVLANVSMPRIDDVEPRIPHDIARLVERAVHRSPQKRFAGMKEFAGAMLECRARWLEYARSHGLETGERDLSRPSVRRSADDESGSAPDAGHDTLTESRPAFLGGISSSKLSGVGFQTDRSLSVDHTPPSRAPATAFAEKTSTADGFERRLRRSKGRLMVWATAGSSVFVGLAIVATASAVYVRTHPRATAGTIEAARLTPRALPRTPAVPNEVRQSLPSAAAKNTGADPPRQETQTASSAPRSDQTTESPTRSPPAAAPSVHRALANGLSGAPKRSTPKLPTSKAHDDFEELLMRRAEKKLKAEEAREGERPAAVNKKNEVWVW